MQSRRNGPGGAPGVQVVHSSFCPSRSGVECTAGRAKGCRPGFRASVYDPKAGVKVKQTFGTMAETKLWRKERGGVVARGRRIAHTTKTLNQAAAEWLAGVKADPPTVLNRGGEPYKPSVIRTYERDLDNYVLPALGAHKLTAIRRGDLKRFVDRLVGRGHSPSKVRNIINPLRAIYREARDAEELEVNPTAGLRLPKVRNGLPRAVEPTELTAFLAALPDDLVGLYATAAQAGLRRGELLGLRWADVTVREGDSPHAGWLHVQRSVDDVEGVIEPTSDAGTRWVPIVRQLVVQLAPQRERTGGEGYVFGENGTTFEPPACCGGRLRRWPPPTPSARRPDSNRCGPSSASTPCATPSGQCSGGRVSPRTTSPIIWATRAGAASPTYTPGIEKEATALRLPEHDDVVWLAGQSGIQQENTSARPGG